MKLGFDKGDKALNLNKSHAHSHTNHSIKDLWVANTLSK